MCRCWSDLLDDNGKEGEKAMIFLELFLTFFKIGAFTFGGGYAMLPLIEEAVTTKNWVDPATFIDFIAVSESTPGPFAINMATFVGAEQGGTVASLGIFGSFFGSLCATLGVVLPSFIVILIVAKIYDAFCKSAVVKGCMSGLKPAVVGLIGAALVSIAMTVIIPAGFTVSIFTEPELYCSIVIMALAIVLSFKKVHPIIIIVVSAILGLVSGYFIL